MQTTVWSSTDMPYACLKDMERVLAFQRAIRHVVSPGDIVVDAGAGSGILSFFAAAAGAHRVIAVEIDPLMASSLRLSVALNGLSEQIVVHQGDVATVELPKNVDVVIGELIETGLMDELQVPVLNALRDRGVIGPQTRIIPERYQTSLELVAVDNTFYGFTIAAPMHEWPNYAFGENGWHPTAIRPLTRREIVSDVSLRNPVFPTITTRTEFLGIADGLANGIRISGISHLCPGVKLGPTNALNGDKILSLADPVALVTGQRLVGQISYIMGGGLASFSCQLGS